MSHPSGSLMAISSKVSHQIYGSSRLGEYRGGRKAGQLTTGRKSYELSNHLGNVLAVVSDAKTAVEVSGSFSHFAPEVLSTSDYYPFGLAMEGRTFSGEGYRFGFGGHEKDDEVKGSGNHLSFGDMGYDPRTGRRWNIDPMAKKYAHQSPYSAFNNSPIYFTDPDGQDAVATVKDKTITISATIYITGHKATADKAKAIQKGIMGTWGKDFTYTDEKGDVYTVKYDIQVKVATDDKNEVGELSKGENLITLLDESGGEVTSHVTGGKGEKGWRTGKWGEDESDKTYAHESGHLLAIDDLYYYDDEGKIHNYKGVDPKDNMGMRAHSADSKVVQKTVDEMAKYVLDNKGDDGTVEIDASHTRFRDKTKLEKE